MNQKSDRAPILSDKAHILLVDDEQAFCELCSLWLQQAGYQVTTCNDAQQARAVFPDNSFDLVLQDLALPPNFLPEESLSLISYYGAVPTVVITGHTDKALTLKAIELGAWDFISKPIDPDMLLVVVQRAVQRFRLQKEILLLQQQLATRKDQVSTGSELGLIGVSQNVDNIRSLIQRIAPTNVAVLIQGPSGTGKEVIARALHHCSLRVEEPFISVHCGAIPSELLESELFGYKKGAFTGAHQDRQGLLAAAHRGTLFLDEIGEMPLSMQVKLLRVLQDGSYFPVGSRQLETIDVRLVSATNRDLPSAIQEGKFREDLFYRIKGLVLQTTRLQQRVEDVPLLVNYFLQRFNRDHNRALRVSPWVLQWFCDGEWRGNVRELKNTLESALAICEDDVLDKEDILLITGDDRDLSYMSTDNNASLPPQSLESQLTALEIRLIHEALLSSQGNKTHAAKALGITRQGLLKKIKRYRLASANE